jgi:hypothetical protein
MNYLQLVNRARVECGVSGGDLVSTSGQTGEAARFTSWINSAYVDIQAAKEDWEWMRTEVTFNLVAEQFSYTPTETGIASTFANWKRNSFRCSTSDSNYGDEQLINFMDWTTFRDLYQYGSMRTTYSRPVVVSVKPNKDLAFGPTPDQGYVIDAEYYQKPTEFSLDADEPALPDRFHMMIIYRAMMFYGGFEAAPEVYQRGEFEFKRLMDRLVLDQLPTTVSGPPLA